MKPPLNTFFWFKTAPYGKGLFPCCWYTWNSRGPTFFICTLRTIQNRKELHFTNLDLFFIPKTKSSCIPGCHFSRRRPVDMDPCWCWRKHVDASRIPQSCSYSNYTVKYSHPWCSTSQMRKDMHATLQWKTTSIETCNKSSLIHYALMY